MVTCIALWFLGPSLAHASAPPVRPSGTPARHGSSAVVSVDVDLTIHRHARRATARDDGSEGVTPLRRANNRAVVEGRAVYRLSASSRERRVFLLDFAAHLATEPGELDEVALGGYADGPWTPSSTTVRGARALGEDPAEIELRRSADDSGWWLTVPAGVDAVAVDYEVAVPRRYWPFGCANGRCSLSGALAPLPSVPARGGVYLPVGGRVVAPARWQVRARFADVADFEVGTSPEQVSGLDGTAQLGARQRDALAGEELIVWGPTMPVAGEARRNDVADEGTLAYPSVVWGRGWHRARQVHRGVEVVVLHMRPRPGGRHPDEGPLQLRRDLPGRVLEIAEEGLDLAGSTLGEFAPGRRLVVIQGPLRSQIAEFHPAAVFVSDQAFEILPAERFFKFHALVIARALLEGLGHAWASAHHDPSTALWEGGAMGFALVNVWQTQRDLRDEYAQDLLRNFTFVPAVDRFLYTEQAQFSGAYFRGSEDDLGPRNHPLWFGHQLPTGRRIHEKLVDLLGAEATAAYHASMARRPDGDPVRTAERVYGRQLDWFFAQWLGPYPEVDYAVSEVRSTRRPDGRWRHRIEVRRDAALPMVEPVQLMVTDRNGARQFLVWNGDPRTTPAPDEAGTPLTLADFPADARHVFEVDTEARLSSVRLDPRARLEQSSRIPTSPLGRADNNDPRFNDRVPPKFRFIYTGFGLSIAASELLTANTPQARVNAVTAFASFEGSLRRDLRRTGTISVLTDRETVVGASAGANFYFLKKRNKQRRRLRLRTGVGGSWLTNTSLDPEGGARLSQSVQLYDDTRAFVWWPERGHILGATVTATQVLRQVDGRADPRYTLGVAGGWSQLIRLARDHVLATTFDIALSFPLADTSPEFRSLVRLGGIGGLSAYTANEVFGRAGAWLQAEYRHLYVNDLPLNFAHLGWLRGIGGVAFGGMGTVSRCDGLGGWFAADSWYGQAGYGLQAHVQALGVTPQLIRLDVAVPLVRRETRCLGESLPDVLAESQGLDPADAASLLPPVTVNLVFNHPF